MAGKDLADAVLDAPCPCSSGKKMRACHGASANASPAASTPGQLGLEPGQTNIATSQADLMPGPAAVVSSSGSPTPSSPGQGMVVRPPVTRRLDLACGQTPREGFEGVDIWPGAQHQVNLQTYPWPFADESVLELYCSHYIEHIPMEYVRVEEQVDFDGLGGRRFVTIHELFDSAGAKDALFAFFDECYRILVPDGTLTIVVPSHRNDRAFQDPTHRRFITAQTFAYMNEKWRRDVRLDHYNVNCNFIGEANPTIPEELALRFPETAQNKMQKEWNTVIDWVARMQKKPRLPPR